MKIGILTLPMHGNIGGVLQNYALVNFLKKYTSEVYTIDYRPHRHELVKAYIFRFIRKIGLSRLIYFTRNEKLVLLYNIRRFIDANISCSGPYYNFNCLKKRAVKFDTIILGSDQVWRKIFIYDSIDIYFLGFLNNKKQQCFSYAASIGTDKCEYSNEELLVINKLIKNFKSISVREYSAISLIENVFKWSCPKPQLVLDPTFLLPAEHYLNLIKERKDIYISKEKNLYYYLLDKNKDKERLLEEFSKRSNLTLYSNYNTSCKAMCSIEQWLSDIFHSDFVVTDSFHGVVFSIIFKKQFAVYINQERGTTRFDSLLKMLGLESRIINNSNIDSILSNRINYEYIQKILDEQRTISIKFIEDNLKK